MTETPLDRAHADMEADPDAEGPRLRFFDRLAAAELFLLLEREPEPGGDLTPQVFPVEGQSFVLTFDTEARLAEFSGQAAAYAALSGRALAEMLSGAGLGLALNPDVAPSAMLLEPAALQWLTETLAAAPATQSEARIDEVFAPAGLPEALLTALDARLSAAAGLARLAYLVGTAYEGGGRGHLLAVIDAVPEAEAALARSVSEALVFSGLEAGALDVAFFRASDAISARLARVGLRFDLPQPETGLSPAPPGMDPDRPPRLT